MRDRIRDWRWYGLLGVVLAVALAAVPFVIAALRDDPPRRLGAAGHSGPVTINVTRVACNKHRLPSPLRERLEASGGVPPIRGQLCFARASFRNDSNIGRWLRLLAAFLNVGDDRFGIAATNPPPRDIGYVFPSARVSMTMIFEIPKGVVPDALSVRYGRGDVLEYRLP